MHQKKPNIVFLIIGFNNINEVNNYITQIDALNNTKYDIDIVITDNIGTFKEHEIINSFYRVTLLNPKNNLGYLNGCSYGLDFYRKSYNKNPSWVCVSNTDLTLDKNILDILDTNIENIGQVSSLIKTQTGTAQNPHLKNRPSQAFLLKQILIHSFHWIGGLYIYLSHIKDKLSIKKDPKEKKEYLIYTSHGSFFFLSKAFFDKGGIIHDAPFLYSEELYIGEQLYRHNLKSVCNTKYTIIHHNHSTSKLVSLYKKSKFMLTSNKLIYEKFYK
ncbi:MAG: hypothetical protein QJT81_08620 [Candidatus Thiothrix putei]|uniref:Glycosyltransferase 2-like domain-containing protein n=1 Tax=Candidatus Thiothrix putei TaxID=3080811 RepID=A0AA95HJE8_9GAMM|nr:MAG: hypothetical protein QJT81_08620 [Candidatus Thiothrix putei]